tara:strand:+ start:1941 stop:2354 length:414 start_codon:yes stop_codon:yes gene_type:complete
MKNCLYCQKEVSIEQLKESLNMSIDNNTENVLLQICCPHCSLSIFSAVDYPDDNLIEEKIKKEWNTRTEHPEYNKCPKCSGLQDTKNVDSWLIKQGEKNTFDFICEQSKYGKGCGLSIIIDGSKQKEILNSVYNKIT